MSRHQCVKVNGILGMGCTPKICSWAVVICFVCQRTVITIVSSKLLTLADDIKLYIIQYILLKTAVLFCRMSYLNGLNTGYYHLTLQNVKLYTLVPVHMLVTTI